jgi:hypothetical protein
VLLRHEGVPLPQVLRLQPAGKKAMSVTDFVNGFVKGRAIQARTAVDATNVPSAGHQQGNQSKAKGHTQVHDREQTQAGIV